MRPILLTFSCILVFMTTYGRTIPNVNSNHRSTEDTVRIDLGQRLLYEAEINSDGNLRLVKVESPIDSSKTLRIEFSFSNGLGTTLKIFNPFTKQLVYKAEIYSDKKKKFTETSTIPVYPGISSFEMWGGKIDTIQLSGFRLLEQ